MGIKVTNAGAQVVKATNSTPKQKPATVIRGTDLRTGK